MKTILGLVILLLLGASVSFAGGDDDSTKVDFDQGTPSVRFYTNADGEKCSSIGTATMCDSNGRDEMGTASEVLVGGQSAPPQPAQAAAPAPAAAPGTAPVNAAVEGLNCRQLLPGPDSNLCDNTLVNAQATASCSSRYTQLTNTLGGSVDYALCSGLASLADADGAVACFKQWRDAANMHGVPSELDDARICRNDPDWRQAFSAFTQLNTYYTSNMLTAGNLWDVVKYTTDAGRTVACVRVGINQGGPSLWNNVQPCVAQPPNPNPLW